MSNKNKPSQKIQLLPEHLVDQIKAGEVVERPSALLKELLENSLDAGSTQIDIHIIENGMELISVEDNGEGMFKEDLPYAFCRHATSKITNFEDIYNLSSFGFRGEALASIAAASRLTCITGPKDQLNEGGKIVIHGGLQKSLTDYSGKKPGTSLFIKDLFFNTPARLKFVKSKISEKNALKRIINAFILSNPSVEFRVKWDQSDKKISPRVTKQNIQKRVKDVFFAKKSVDTELLYFNNHYENYFVKGYTSRVFSKGTTGKGQYLFINGRLFTDRAIHQSIQRAMDKVWQGQMGHYFICLTLPPDEIDVNVHPSKTLIKFNKPNQVISLVGAAIKDVLKNEASPKEAEIPIKNHDNEKNYLNYLETIGSQGHLLKQENGENTQSIQLSNFIDINENYCIVNNNDQKLIVDKNKLIGRFLIKNLLLKFPLPESQITPVLIGTPFLAPSKKVQNIFSYLSSLGFIFDIIDKDTIILRAYPSVLEKHPIDYLVNEIFLYFEQKKEIPNEEDFKLKFEIFLQTSTGFGKNIKDDNLLYEIFKTTYNCKSGYFFKQNIGIELNNNFLGSLFS